VSGSQGDEGPPAAAAATQAARRQWVCTVATTADLPLPTRLCSRLLVHQLHSAQAAGGWVAEFFPAPPQSCSEAFSCAASYATSDLCRGLAVRKAKGSGTAAVWSRSFSGARAGRADGWKQAKKVDLRDR